MRNRNLGFVLGTLGTLILFGGPLMAFAKFSFSSAVYPYTMMIPFVSAGLVYFEKNRVFSRVRYDWGAGALFIVLGLSLRLYTVVRSGAPAPQDPLSLPVFSFVLVWIGVFASCYGTLALRAAAFQASILLLMVPLPQGMVDKTIFVLRGCSAQAAAAILKLFGVPVFQNGFRLLLPGVDVEVAEQCSGIRSALALFITSLLMGRLFLRSPWRRLWLTLAIFPVTIFKNGCRIVTIYLLTAHTNMESLTLWFHHNGGIPFSFLGISLLALLVISLRRFEDASVATRLMIGRESEFAKGHQTSLSI